MIKYGTFGKRSGVARRGEIRRMTSVHVEEEEEVVVQQQDNFIKKSVYAVGGAPLSPRVISLHHWVGRRKRRSRRFAALLRRHGKCPTVFPRCRPCFLGRIFFLVCRLA